MFYGMLYKLLIIMFLHSKATSNLHSFDPPSQYPRYCCELSLAQLVRLLVVKHVDLGSSPRLGTDAHLF